MSGIANVDHGGRPSPFLVRPVMYRISKILLSQLLQFDFVVLTGFFGESVHFIFVIVALKIGNFPIVLLLTQIKVPIELRSEIFDCFVYEAKFVEGSVRLDLVLQEQLSIVGNELVEDSCSYRNSGICR